MAVTQVTGAFNLGNGNSGVFTQSGPPTPTANISSATTINEGAALSFTVTTTGIADLTSLYWGVIPGTASLTDFTEVTGSFQIVGGVGSFSVTPTSELAASGSTTFAVAVKLNNPIYGETIGLSNSVIKNDTNAIVFSSIPSSINEGSSGTFNVATTGVANGTTLYWKIPNTTDFATTTGSFIISANVGSFAVTPSADLTTEGPETFTVEIRTGTVTGPVVATSSSVTINDTSIGAVSTYAFTTTPSSINEGSAGTFVITTTGVTNATTLYWTVETNAGDFATSSGSFTVTSNSGTFSVTPTADVTTEGAETFTVAVRTVGTSGAIVATSASVTINDTSVAPSPFGIIYAIAGGGGGGLPNANDGGGGGGGGFLTNNPLNTNGGPGTRNNAMTLVSGTSYPITIGGGGSSSSGTPSIFNGVTALGGGRGGGTVPGTGAGSPGGSGGGAGGISPFTGGTATPTNNGGYPSSIVQGFAGGTYSSDSGGGGGAGGVGSPGGPGPLAPTRAWGGAGKATNIPGTPTLYCGGGGGGNDTAGGAAGQGGAGGGGRGGFPSPTSGVNGTAGSGGGGGGTSNSPAVAGTGGGGAILLRYPNARTLVLGPGVSALTLNSPVSSDYYSEINSGSGTISWT